MGVFEIVSLYCGQVFIEIQVLKCWELFENTESRKKETPQNTIRLTQAVMAWSFEVQWKGWKHNPVQLTIAETRRALQLYHAKLSSLLLHLWAIWGCRSSSIHCGLIKGNSLCLNRKVIKSIAAVICTPSNANHLQREIRALSKNAILKLILPPNEMHWGALPPAHSHHQDGMTCLRNFFMFKCLFFHCHVSFRGCTSIFATSSW